MNTADQTKKDHEIVEFVEFTFDQSQYGVSVDQVSEIIMCRDTIVPFPDAAESITGVINLRGTIVPIVDLSFYVNSQKLGAAANGALIIIIEYETFLVGFRVNAVSCIQRVAAQAIDTTYEQIQSKHGYAYGVARIDEKIIFLLDFVAIVEAIGMTKIKNIKKNATENESPNAG